MSILSVFSTPPPAAAHFVPSDRFFLRLVPLAADLPVLEQAELALEGSAPFPPAQLFWGCAVSPDRTQALIYAAHRRRFNAEEIAAWNHAELVVPGIVALLGAAPAKGPVVVVVESAAAIYGAAWPAGANWPTVVLARALAGSPDAAAVELFAAELAAKAGLADAAVQRATTPPTARWADDVLIFEQTAGGKTLAGPQLAKADADALDVREREFLLQRREEKRRGALIWKLMLGGLAAAALALVFELGSAGFSVVTKMRLTRATEQTPLVQRLETANGLVGRIDELTRRRLRFFEMIALVNEARPRSVQFTRTGSNGRTGLDIEAQSPNADDVGNYTKALLALPAIEKADASDIRGRDGVTTFALKIVFKPDALAALAVETPPPVAPAPASAPAPTAKVEINPAAGPAKLSPLPSSSSTPATEPADKGGAK